LERIEQ